MFVVKIFRLVPHYACKTQLRQFVTQAGERLLLNVLPVKVSKLRTTLVQSLRPRAYWLVQPFVEKQKQLKVVELCDIQSVDEDPQVNYSEKGGLRLSITNNHY